jgi:hypothetical protein
MLKLLLGEHISLCEGSDGMAQGRARAGDHAVKG